MTDNPYIEIDLDYSETVDKALAEHEDSMSEANLGLNSDLAAANDPIEQAEILSAFDLKISPARKKYHDEIEKAEEARNLAKAKVETAYLAFNEENDRQEVADRAALVAKLKEGHVAHDEVREILIAMLEGKIRSGGS